VELATERLVLREFREDDWPDVLAYQSDPRYLQYYRWTERTREDAVEFVHTFIAQQEERPRARFQFAVALKSDPRLIGNCGIRMGLLDAHETDIGDFGETFVKFANSCHSCLRIEQPCSGIRQYRFRGV